VLATKGSIWETGHTIIEVPLTDAVVTVEKRSDGGTS